MALAGELQRQEMSIRQSNPNYDQTDDRRDLRAFSVSRRQPSRSAAALRADRECPPRAVHREQDGSVNDERPLQGSGTSEIPTAPQNLDEAYRAALGHLAEAGIDTSGNSRLSAGA
jgi:hypothetical protein